MLLLLINCRIMFILGHRKAISLWQIHTLFQDRVFVVSLVCHDYTFRIKQLFKTADLMYSIPLHRATIYIFGIFTGYAMRMYKNVKLSKVCDLFYLSQNNNHYYYYYTLTIFCSALNYRVNWFVGGQLALFCFRLHWLFPPKWETWITNTIRMMRPHMLHLVRLHGAQYLLGSFTPRTLATQVIQIDLMWTPSLLSAQLLFSYFY